MKRKLLIALLSLTTAACCAVGLAACDKGGGDEGGDNQGNTGITDYPTYTKPDNQTDTKLEAAVNDSGTYTITGIGEENKTDIVIPAMIGEVPVTTIADGAFNHRTDITSIKIENGIKIIGANAFNSCTGIDSISIPDSVTTVGIGAFQNCSGIKAAVLSENLKEVSDNMFRNCEQLISITIPDSVESVGANAFTGCKALKTVNMGSGVLTVGDDAFSPCEGLEEITLGPNVQIVGNRVFNSCINLKSVTIPNSVTSIGEDLLVGCEQSIKYISIPFTGAKKWEGDLFDTPDPDAADFDPDQWEIFEDARHYTHFGYLFGAESNREHDMVSQGILSGITVAITGDSSIFNGAFNNFFGVETIIVSGNVKEIGTNAFGATWNLKTLVLPKTLVKIFSGAALYTDTITDVFYMGTSADWSQIVNGGDNGSLFTASRHYADSWHFVNGMPTLN